MLLSALRPNHWAIILLETVLLSIFCQQSEAKNMADFHVCWRHMVPPAHGIYHWPTAILCLKQNPTPPCFSTNFYCLSSVFAKIMKNCVFVLVICKKIFTLKYKECFSKVSCIKNYYKEVFNTFYLGNISHDKYHFSRQMHATILLKCQTVSLETRLLPVFTSFDQFCSYILYFRASCPSQTHSFSVFWCVFSQKCNRVIFPLCTVLF